MVLSVLMVNFFRTFQRSVRLALGRTAVMLPVNKLAPYKESNQILGLGIGVERASHSRIERTLLGDRWPLRLSPSEMLPAVEGYHLTGHRGCR